MDDGKPSTPQDNVVSLAEVNPTSPEEMAKYRKELEAKDLAAILRTEKELKEQHDKEEAALHASFQKDKKDDLAPMTSHHQRDVTRMKGEDNQKVEQTIKENGLRNEKFLVRTQEGKDPEEARQEIEKLLDEKFKGQKMATMVVQESDGKTAVAVMGISVDEYLVARDLKAQEMKIEMAHQILSERGVEKSKNPAPAQDIKDKSRLMVPDSKHMVPDSKFMAPDASAAQKTMKPAAKHLHL